MQVPSNAGNADILPIIAVSLNSSTTIFFLRESQFENGHQQKLDCMKPRGPNEEYCTNGSQTISELSSFASSLRNNIAYNCQDSFSQFLRMRALGFFNSAYSRRARYIPRQVCKIFGKSEQASLHLMPYLFHQWREILTRVAQRILRCAVPTLELYAVWPSNYFASLVFDLLWASC